MKRKIVGLIAHRGTINECPSGILSSGIIPSASIKTKYGAAFLACHFLDFFVIAAV
jgi:hypothetical protein